MADNTHVLSRGMVRGLLEDKSFFSKFPEFRQLESKLRTMGVDLNSGRGCRGCRRRRVENTLLRDFLIILRGVPEIKLNALKQHLGVEKLMYSLHNPGSGAYETKII